VTVAGPAFEDLGNGIVGFTNDAGEWIEGAGTAVANWDGSVTIQFQNPIQLAQTSGPFDFITDLAEDAYDWAEGAVDTISGELSEVYNTVADWGQGAMVDLSKCDDSIGNALYCYSSAANFASDAYGELEDIAEDAASYTEAQINAAIADLE